jgi:hypothetical protein
MHQAPARALTKASDSGGEGSAQIVSLSHKRLPTLFGLNTFEIEHTKRQKADGFSNYSRLNYSSGRFEKIFLMTLTNLLALVCVPPM